MLSDRFLFVTAALVTMALWAAWDRQRPSQREIWPLADLDQPDIGSVLVILIGAVYGALSAKIILGLFTRGISPRTALYGAAPLLVLSVAYGLPLYQREISGLLRDSGLSTLKVSVAEISVEALPAAHGTQGSDSARGQATGSPSLSISRATDPTPGIEALKADFGQMDDPPKDDQSGEKTN